jgi:cyclophilin family peptidyl-prolyl cis-trans isomerase
MKKVRILLILGGCLAATALASYSNMLPAGLNPFAGSRQNEVTIAEGRASVVTITAGPFDIHRRYRSMEGPYIPLKATIGDLVATKNINLPENKVVYIENPGSVAPPMGATSMASNSFQQMMSGNKLASQIANQTTHQNLVDTSKSPRTLYWFKGLKLEVLDENDRLLPTAEFICHYNLDVDPGFRNDAFPIGERCVSGRIVTITQGQTEIMFPTGFAVPVASDEPWRMFFQAANRTTNDHRRLKHRCTLYFIKESDLVYPITALNWFTPYVRVALDKNTPEAMKLEKKGCPSCFGISDGVNAPNNSPDGLIVESTGRRVSGHWVIPPGIHSYRTIVDDAQDPGFYTKDRIIHAVWSHLHPLATNLTLYKCSGKTRTLVFSNKEQTKTFPGLEIEHIDYLSSKEGMPLPMKGNVYELEVTYNNTTGQPQDSMSVAGIFCEDHTFARPPWVFEKPAAVVNCLNSNTCSQAPGKIGTITSNNPASLWFSQLPLFDRNKDGPILTSKKQIEIKTNAGPIRIELYPAVAPMTCTQLYKLFTNHAYDGTPICQYEPGYLIQVALAEDRAAGQPVMPAKVKDLLRRLPVEIPVNNSGVPRHKAGSLTLARGLDQPSDNGTSSFSILLTDASHLDRNFTMFGNIVDNADTKKTIEKIKSRWSKQKFWIVSTQALP